MIDTDKYTGHNLDDTYTECYGQDSKKHWSVMNLDAASCLNGITNMHKPTAQLIADASLLLAEVKRLREAFITAVRHLDVESRNKMFNDMDADLQSIWLFRSE